MLVGGPPLHPEAQVMLPLLPGQGAAERFGCIVVDEVRVPAKAQVAANTDGWKCGDILRNEADQGRGKAQPTVIDAHALGPSAERLAHEARFHV